MKQPKKQSAELLDAKELLAKLRKKYPVERDLRHVSRISRSTIWRIDEGYTNFDPATLGKLVKALNA